MSVKKHPDNVADNHHHPYYHFKGSPDWGGDSYVIKHEADNQKFAPPSADGVFKSINPSALGTKIFLSVLFVVRIFLISAYKIIN